jgi:low affinity Fe/Cu permease
VGRWFAYLTTLRSGRHPLRTLFSMVVISSTQNRDITAMHVKLNELIGPVQAADHALMRAEDETDEELEALKRHATALSQTHAILTSYPGPAKTNR